MVLTCLEEGVEASDRAFSDRYSAIPCAVVGSSASTSLVYSRAIRQRTFQSTATQVDDEEAQISTAHDGVGVQAGHACTHAENCLK